MSFIINNNDASGNCIKYNGDVVYRIDVVSGGDTTTVYTVPYYLIEGQESATWDAYRDTSVELGNTTLVIPYFLDDTDTIASVTGFEDTPITSLVFESIYTDIGESAFENCTQLKSVTWNSVSYYAYTPIGQNAFKGCTSLTSIRIPEGVTSIGDSAFEGCTSLESVILPNTLVSLGASAFKGCTNLTSITLSSNLSSIPTSAFFNTGLTSVYIPESVTSISASAFENCRYLTTVTGCRGLQTIGSSAFSNCSSLGSFEFWPILRQLDNYAFYGCSSLDVSTGLHNTSITTLTRQCLDLGRNIATISLPPSLTKIEYYAFGANTIAYAWLPLHVWQGDPERGGSTFDNASLQTSANIGAFVTSSSNWKIGVLTPKSGTAVSLRSAGQECVAVITALTRTDAAYGCQFMAESKATETSDWELLEDRNSGAPFDDNGQIVRAYQVSAPYMVKVTVTDRLTSYNVAEVDEDYEETA